LNCLNLACNYNFPALTFCRSFAKNSFTKIRVDFFREATSSTYILTSLVLTRGYKQDLIVKTDSKELIIFKCHHYLLLISDWLWVALTISSFC